MHVFVGYGRGTQGRPCLKGGGQGRCFLVMGQKDNYKTVLHTFYNVITFVLVRNQQVALEQTFWHQHLDVLPETKDTP